MQHGLLHKANDQTSRFRIQEAHLTGIIGILDFLLITTFGLITFAIYPGWQNEAGHL